MWILHPDADTVSARFNESGFSQLLGLPGPKIIEMLRLNKFNEVLKKFCGKTSHYMLYYLDAFVPEIA